MSYTLYRMGRDAKTIMYAYPSYPFEEDSSGFYLPDAVIDPVVQALKPVLRGTFERHLALESAGSLPALSRHKILIPEPRLSLEESFSLVVRAFESFDTRLGVMAREAIEDKSRWRLEKVEAGLAGGGLVTPGNDYNETGSAMVSYQYDGTINDAVYIAHELGHLFAHDNGGAGGDDEKRHMGEIQAFFTQSILYHSLMNGSSAVLKRAATQHFCGEMTRGLYDVVVGLAALESEKIVGAPMISANKYDIIMNDFLGPHSRRLIHASYVGDNISDFKARDFGIGELHRHSMASIIADGLLDRALRGKLGDRNQLIDVLYGPRAKGGIYGLFDAAQVSTTAEALQDFAVSAVSLAIRPVEKMTVPVLTQKSPKTALFSNKTAIS